jgi:hypothetical protein
MGVPGGAKIWDETEARWQEWLVPEAEQKLVERLAERFRSR